VFSFDSMDSLEHTVKWKESVAQVKEMPYVLVGNKSDLESKDTTPEKIEARQRDFKCRYHACSAYTGMGIENAINEILLECFKPIEEFIQMFEAELLQTRHGSETSETNKFYDL